MNSKQSLTEEQKRLLSKYEPLLQQHALRGDIEKAKEYCAHIMQILRPTGHETRILQNKIWLCEALIESGSIDFATTALIGIYNKSSKNTVLRLEAATLLAICHIRNKNIIAAQPYIHEAMNSHKSISSPERQRLFRTLLLKRLEEESIIATRDTSETCSLNEEEITTTAGKLIRTKTEDELFALIGESTPQVAIKYLRDVHELSKRQIPAIERIALPHPPDRSEPRKIGKRVFSALGRVLYKSLCDKDNDIYKMWFTNGISGLLNKKVLVPAILSSVCGFQTGTYTIAASMTALIIKFGIDVYCESFVPERLMDIKPQRRIK